MATIGDYVTGTITLTSGSANFTTSGAALQTVGITAGDEIWLPAKGMALVIASITGENSGTLVAACPAGAAGASQPLRVRFQGDGSRYNASVREMIEALKDGKLTSLASLTGAADRQPYMTGPTTFALTNLTASARAMQALNGAAGQIPVYTGTATAAARDIVGTVAQSGGTPTGSIVEAGSNANGNYLRTADGTQICWTEIDDTANAWNTSVTGGFVGAGGAWVYPAAFAGGVTGMRFFGSNVINSAAPNGVIFTARSGTQVLYRPYCSVSIAAAVTKVSDLMAIGRWF